MRLNIIVEYMDNCLSAQNKESRRGGWNWLDHQYYSPLYEKGITKIENKSMETTLHENFKNIQMFLKSRSIHLL